MTSILMIVVVIVFVPGVIWLMMRIVVRTERASRERRHEAWRAGGSVGAGPGGCSGGCSSSGGGGCGGGGCGGGGN